MPQTMLDTLQTAYRDPSQRTAAMLKDWQRTITDKGQV